MIIEKITKLIIKYTRCVQKVSRILNWSRLHKFDFWFFCGVMLVLIFLIYKYGHFECSVNFWQLFCLHSFWFVFDFCLFQKMDQRICSKLMRGRIPNVDCGIWWSYLGPKQRLSVVQNVLRGPRKCERRREKLLRT